MFPRPLATNVYFQYTVTGDLSCMECMIYDSLFGFFLSVSMYVILILSGVAARKTTFMWLCWEINILYLVSCIW